MPTAEAYPRIETLIERATCSRERAPTAALSADCQRSALSDGDSRPRSASTARLIDVAGDLLGTALRGDVLGAHELRCDPPHPEGSAGRPRRQAQRDGHISPGSGGRRVDDNLPNHPPSPEDQ